MAEPLKIPATNIRVHQDHVGGGFGSKFRPDRWGIATAAISKKAGWQTGTHDAGARFGIESRRRTAVGVCPREGRCEERRHRSWHGNRNHGGREVPAAEACRLFPTSSASPTNAKNTQRSATTLARHARGEHQTIRKPQSLPCALWMTWLRSSTWTPVEFFCKNIDLATKDRQSTYREELGIAADLMGWKAEVASPGPECLWQSRARCRPLDAYLGRPRPRQRLRPDHPS